MKAFVEQAAELRVVQLQVRAQEGEEAHLVLLLQLALSHEPEVPEPQEVLLTEVPGVRLWVLYELVVAVVQSVQVS